LLFGRFCRMSPRCDILLCHFVGYIVHLLRSHRITSATAIVLIFFALSLAQQPECFLHRRSEWRYVKEGLFLHLKCPSQQQTGGAFALLTRAIIFLFLPETISKRSHWILLDIARAPWHNSEEKENALQHSCRT
jgi:hypothetical protein